MIRPFLAVLILTATPLVAPAQITGTVTGEDVSPLEAASVQAFAATTGAERAATITDTDGRFSLAGLPPGRYQVVVSHVGYAPHHTGVDLAAHGVALQVTLSARALENPAVVVSASRARKQLTPVTHSNVTARDLALLPSMNDLPSNLRSSTAITYYSENGNDMGYTHLRLRGFGQRRIAVAINGVPQNDPEEHSVFWINFYDLQGSIKDIQIQRGAGSAFYGSSGIGGAINVVTSPYASRPYARVDLGYGTYNTRRYTVAGNTGLIGGRYVAHGRFSRLLSDGYRDWSWTKFWRFFVGVTRYGERHTLTLQAYGGPQNDALAYSGIPKEANEAPFTDAWGTTIDRRYNFSGATRDVEWFHQPHAELIHEWQWSPGVRFKQTAFWVAGIGHFDFGGTFRSADYLRLPEGWRDMEAEMRTWPLYNSAPDAQVLFRAALDQYQVGWLPRVTWDHASGETALGLEARLHRSLRWGRVEEATGLPAEVIGGANDYRVYSVRGEKLVSSFIGSHLARVHDLLAVQADVQLTWRQYRIFDEAYFGNAFQVPYVFLNPRLGVTFAPESAISGYASIALANREPRMKSLYDGEEAGAGAMPQFAPMGSGGYDYDAPVVKPERLLNVELGAQVTRQSWRLVANFYFMQFTDEIVPSGGLDQFGVPRTGNADRTRHVGIEVEVSARLAPGLDVYANGTRSQSRFVRFTEYTGSEYGEDRAGNPIAGFPASVANVGLRYTRGGLGARLDLLYTGLQYIDNAGSGPFSFTAPPDNTVDPHALLNGSVRYAFGPSSPLSGLELYADGNNLLSDRVLLFGNVGFGTAQYFPSARRSVFFGARYTLR